MAEKIEAPLLSDRTAEEALQPLVNVSIAFIVINTFFVIAKTVSRARIARLPFWWDDFWIIPAYLAITGISALGIFMAKTEVRYNNEDRIIMNLEELKPLLKAIYAVIQLLLPSFAFTRYSILALYLRVFSDRAVRIATWVVVGFITLQYIGYGFAAIFMCTPVQFFWNRALPGGSCVEINNFYRSFTIPNIIMDVAIIILPIPTVWQLKASSLRKWALTFVFCIGTIALVASCIRLWVYETHTGEVLAPQYTNVLIAWLVVEPSIYLIAACLPAMHHIFAAGTPQFIRLWLEKRMAALKHPLSRTARGTNLSQTSAKAVGARYGDFSRLSDPDESNTREGNDSKVRSGARKGRKDDSDIYELESGFSSGGGDGLGGIMVTREVIVTQEERIADVIGF